MDAQKSGIFLKKLKNVHPSMALKGHVARGVVVSVISFVLGICPLPLSAYPLGIAYFCALSKNAVFALIGLIPAAFFTSLSSVAYLFSILLAVTSRVIFGYFIDKEKAERPPFFEFLFKGGVFDEAPSLRVTSGAVSIFALCLFGIISGGFLYYDLFGAILSLLIGVCAVMIFGGINDDKEIPKLYRISSLIVTCAAISLSLSSLSLLGINLGLSSAFFFTILFCAKKGIVPALTVALLCGLASGTQNVPPLLIAAFSAYCVLDVSGLLAASVACIAATISGVAISGGEYIATPFLSLLLGVAAFSALMKISATQAAAKPRESFSLSSLIKEAEGEYLKRRLENLSTELLPVSEISMKLFDSVSLIRKITDETEAEFAESKQLSASISRRLYELGFGRMEVRVLGQRGTRIFIFSNALAPKKERLGFLKKQVEEIMGFPLKLIEAKEMPTGSLTIFEREPVISYYHTVSSVAKESLCGDSAEVFFDPARQCAFGILCDGMGSGEKAHEFSMEALSLLKALLLSGMNPHTAVASIGRALSISNICKDQELTTTVDLLYIDLYTGEATLIKSGATPSYLKRGDKLLRYSAESAPLGIFSKNPTGEISFMLVPEDVFIMVSDGVSECEADSIPLLKYLSECDSSPKDIANDITRIAKDEGKEDDLTALAIKIFPLGY